MPPYYPDQYSDQYQNGAPYYDQYNQYQYNAPPQPQRSPAIPPFSQIQINLPPRPAQYQYQPPQQTYAQPGNLPQYQFAHQHQHQQQYQHQHQHQHHPQYEPQYNPQFPRPTQTAPYQQQYYQNMPPLPEPQMQQMHYQQPAQPVQQIQQIQNPQPPSKIQQGTQLDAVRPHAPVKRPMEPESKEQEPDYAILLLSLADEYLEAASRMSVRSEEYFKLMATALGCIESALANFKLPPLREAQVSLRYAQILLNETENHDKAETILTRAVELCERMKFIDLKYAAQLVLAQVLYRSSPRAALKDLQGMIEDIEAYRHSAWEYAFRLQYVMFLMTSGLPNDVHAAISQLEKLDSAALRNGDHAVHAFAAILQALVHLRTSNAESVTASQQALAKARASQLNPDVADNPQMMIMSEFVDLCGQIKNLDTAQSEQKRKVMQGNLYELLESPAWRNDALMYIAVKTSSLRGQQLQESGIIVERHGRHYLALTWLPKDEVENLGYLFSGISAACKNAGEGGKAERFLDEGLEVLSEIIKDRRPMNDLGDRVQIRRQLVECHFLLERVFLQCSKGQWAKARAAITMVENTATELKEHFPSDMKCVLDYVKGAVCQGCGDLDQALGIYMSNELRLHQQTIIPTSKTSGQAQKQSDVAREISILAAINTVFIIQQPSHPQHYRLQQLVNVLDPLAHNCSNKIIQAAYNFVLASMPNNTILKTKQYLSNTLHAVQAINNAQITTLCLVSMQEKFFRGVVGEQAIKCARAATHQAKRLNEPMWIAVASGLESECLSVHGMEEDALKKKEDCDRMLNILPPNVRVNEA